MPALLHCHLCGETENVAPVLIAGALPTCSACATALARNNVNRPDDDDDGPVEAASAAACHVEKTRRHGAIVAAPLAGPSQPRKLVQGSRGARLARDEIKNRPCRRRRNRTKPTTRLAMKQGAIAGGGSANGLTRAHEEGRRT